MPAKASALSSDDLICRARQLAAFHRTLDPATADVLAELAARYGAAIRVERRRWKSARRAFGPGIHGGVLPDGQ